MDPPTPQSNSQQPPSLEELTMRSATSLLLLPYILSMSPPPRHVAVFLNPTTRSVTLVEGYLDFESILNDVISSKDGPLPASKESIDSLPVITTVSGECPICLVEFDEEVKEMPCKHMFCKGCIDKWLSLHGSCPVCRYVMPVAVDDDQGKGITSMDVGVDHPGIGNGWAVRVVFVRGNLDPGMGQNNESVDEEMDMESID